MAAESPTRRWLESVALFGLPFLLYLPSLDFGLLDYDDSRYYLVNPALREGARGLVAIFTSSFFSDYMPVTQLSWWLDVTLFGDEHFTGARLHGLAWFGAATLALRALVTRVTGRRDVALAVALLCQFVPCIPLPAAAANRPFPDRGCCGDGAQSLFRARLRRRWISRGRP